MILSNRAYSIIWCVTYYIVLTIACACQPFMLYVDSSAQLLSQIVTALPPTYWLVQDAKLRRSPIPHVIQPIGLALWILAPKLEKP